METYIMAKFLIEGKEFGIEDINQALKLKPNELKIEYTRNNEDTEINQWILSTDYEKSVDISEQIDKITEIIGTKIFELKHLKNTYNINYTLRIFIRIKNESSTPAICLEADFFKFLAKIDGVFRIEPYIFNF